MMEDSVKRGDIFYADLSPVVGSEQGGTRPVLIVQNDTGNRVHYHLHGLCVVIFMFVFKIVPFLPKWNGRQALENR